MCIHIVTSVITKIHVMKKYIFINIKMEWLCIKIINMNNSKDNMLYNIKHIKNFLLDCRKINS